MADNNAILVDMPDGSVAEFPAGTDDATIEAAIRTDVAKTRLKGMSSFRKSLYGAERALDEKALGLKQIFPKALGGGLTPEDESELAIRREMENQIPGSSISRIAGEVGLLAAPAARVGQGVAAIKGIAPKVGQYLTAAGVGAGSGAITPVLGDEDRGENTLVGGVLGVGGKAVGDLVGRGIKGIVAKNPRLAALPQAIRDKLTLGMTADKDTLMGRIASATEEKAQSILFAGDLIRMMRNKARGAYRDDVVERGAPKGFTPQGRDTREKMASAYDEYKKRYGAALDGHQITPSQLFEQQVAKITNNPRSGLSAREQEEVREKVMAYYRDMYHGNSPNTGPAGTAAVLQGGQRGTPISADAKNAKEFEAFLTSMGAQAAKSQSPTAQGMEQMYRDLERAWSVSYRRQLPSSSRLATKELDETYPLHKTTERAASYTGNDYGDFTPSQMVQAVRARTPTSRFARGQGVHQEEASVARDALLDRVPNSGTADRAIALGSLAPAILDPVSTATTLGVGVPMMVTKGGRNLMTGDTKIQQLLKRLRADKAASAVGPLAGPSFANISTGEYEEE